MTSRDLRCGVRAYDSCRTRTPPVPPGIRNCSPISTACCARAPRLGSGCSRRHGTGTSRRASRALADHARLQRVLGGGVAVIGGREPVLAPTPTHHPTCCAAPMHCILAAKRRCAYRRTCRSPCGQHRPRREADAGAHLDGNDDHRNWRRRRRTAHRAARGAARRGEATAGFRADTSRQHCSAQPIHCV